MKTRQKINGTKYVISTNGGADYIKKTGVGKTWIYSSSKDATKFSTMKKAKEYADLMPKTLNLKVVPYLP